MNVFSRVSLLALGPVVGAACRAAGVAVAAEGASAVTRFLTERFFDQSLRVGDALASASEQAWRTLEVALAGESVLTAADRAEEKALRERVRRFLLHAQRDGRAAANRDFAARCLAELRAARAAGLLVGEADPAALAPRLGELARFDDPAALAEAQWALADELAADLDARGFGALAEFLTLRPAHDPTAPPLLAVAARHHFRRAAEDDPRLFRGLAFAQLERIGRAQEDGANALTTVLMRLDELHDAVTLPLAEEVAEPPRPALAESAVERFRAQTNGVLAASPDGTRVLGGSPFDGKLRLFDAAKGQELRRLPGHAGWVTCVAFSPDGARAASGGADGTVKLWDVAAGKLLRTWALTGATPAAVAFADGRVQARCAGGVVRKLG